MEPVHGQDNCLNTESAVDVLFIHLMWKKSCIPHRQTKCLGVRVSLFKPKS